MVDTPPSLLAQYILDQLEKRGWSQSELARRASVAKGTISFIVRDEVIPETATVEQIADALTVDRGFMLHLLADRASGVATLPLHPSAAYIARRITELPEGLREAAIEAIGGVVDTISKALEQNVNDEEIDEKQLDAAITILLANSESKDVEELRTFLERLRREDPFYLRAYLTRHLNQKKIADRKVK